MKTSFLAVLTTIFVLHYFYFHFIPLNDVHYLHYVVIGLRSEWSKSIPSRFPPRNKKVSSQQNLPFSSTEGDFSGQNFIIANDGVTY